MTWQTWLGAVSALGMLWLLKRALWCAHPADVQRLLPATTDVNGQPLPTRWQCERCGHERPFRLWDDGQRPQVIRKHDGYDKGLQEAAAVRATKHAGARRALDVQLARPIRAVAASVPSADEPRVTPFARKTGS